MRIALCGISSESCGFSQHITQREDFVESRGAELLAGYDLEEVAHPESGTEVEWVPILSAAATPGGEVDATVFDALVQEIYRGLIEGGPFDGVYLDLHGAVKVRGREHAEEEFVRGVRGVVGPHAVVSASMDPHGNLSFELAHLLDLACAHRHSPHIDQADTKKRAIENLVRVVASGKRPAKAWVRVPSLLPGERTATIVEPGRTVFARSAEVAIREDIVDANLWTGFAWADEPRCSASVLVTAHEEQQARAGAEELAEHYWRARSDLVLAGAQHGTFDEALDFVLEGAPSPCFISDAGDNITAGASGDTTHALHRTLARADLADSGRQLLFAGLYDPATVERAAATGAGGSLDCALGAWLDDRFGSPAAGPWSVEEVLHGPLDDVVTGALVRRGGIWVSVQNRRVLFGTPEDAAAWPFDLRGLTPVDVDRFDAVVVKNGYLLPSQVARTASSFLATTPGPTDVDTARLPYARIQRPMYPVDVDFDFTPTAEVVPTWLP
ncbi:MAG: M81 family metallopeptidase [Propionibacteriaceae bacterium]